MTNIIRSYAAQQAGAALVRYDFDAGELAADQVEIKVAYCGICHSDLSMLNNEWEISQYPLIAGHEVVGEIVNIGSAVKGLHVGQKVGLGWTAGSCQHCDACIAGKGNLCTNSVPTVGKGGFADKVRAQWQWVIPLPEGINLAKAGPLFCGGMTVFEPMLQHRIQANQKIGVIGIGGLGHLALGFLNAWGCEVVAFSSNPDKKADILAMGAHSVLNSRSPEELAQAKGTFDLIISTVNVKLDWNSYLGLLKPEGTLHYVGATLEPLDISAFSLISGQRSVSGSPVGSPIQLREMIRFAARKQVEPIVEEFPMSKINDAIAHLEAGKARYRIVLKNDFE